MNRKTPVLDMVEKIYERPLFFPRKEGIFGLRKIILSRKFLTDSIGWISAGFVRNLIRSIFEA